MFLLAHLSDPHLAPLPQPRWSELIGKRATGYLNWRRRRHLIHRSDVLARIVADLKAQFADHIAVTGDLVNIALPAEFPAARAFLETLGPPHDVTLVPGNHDAYVRRAARDREQHWAEYMRGDEDAIALSDEVDFRLAADNASTQKSTSHVTFPFVRRRGSVALIGVSTAVPTAPLMATGRLGGAQIARLATALDRCAGLFRVVLIHHPPISKPSRRFKRLVDGTDLRMALARHGAELVIHGHDHERARIELEGPGATGGPRGPSRSIPVIGVPSASEAPPGKHDPAGYNLYWIEGTSGAWRCEMVSRGLSGDGDSIVELERTMLVGD
jgi:3',5'-cyclic AMP phosphodiesterase CpdA